MISVSFIWEQMEPAMTHPQAPEALAQQREDLHHQLTTLGDLRQGSLRSQYRKCGKPNCHCAHEGAQGHGPYWLLTWADRDTGKTRGRSIPTGAVEQTRAQIEEYRRLRALVRELVEVSDRLCDARLDAHGPGTPGNRGLLGASSRRRSRPKPSV